MQKTKSYLNRLIVSTAALAITTPAWATTVGVPEPNTLFLIGAGVVSAILIARYKTKK